MTKSFLHFLLVVISASMVGCTSDDRPANLPKLLPIAVKITQEGTPVTGAFVRLVPEDASMPWSCGGTTNETGIATIRTVGKYDGAPEGAYKVVVSKSESGPAGTSPTDLSNLKGAPTKGAEVFDLIDPKFANPTKTTLKLKVSEDASSHEFDVGATVHLKQQGPR